MVSVLDHLNDSLSDELEEEAVFRISPKRKTYFEQDDLSDQRYTGSSLAQRASTTVQRVIHCGIFRGARLEPRTISWVQTICSKARVGFYSRLPLRAGDCPVTQNLESYVPDRIPLSLKANSRLAPLTPYKFLL